MQSQNLPSEWQVFADGLPPFCSRDLIADRSQVVQRGTLANLDSIGQGIPNGRKVGKKICYPKADVVSWLMAYCGVNAEMGA